jgi:hypothetical protein
MRALLLFLLVSLVGCAGQVVTEVQEVFVSVPCRVSAGLLAMDEAPIAPTGDYSQKDVADFISELHEWADAGWLRIGAIDKWVTQHCE